MSGSRKLSNEERQEMIQDAKNAERGKAFNSARMLSQLGGIDEYIDFLSENIDCIQFTPSIKTTKYNNSSFAP